MTSLFLGNNSQHQPVCAKTISSWVRKVLGVAKAHMSQGSLWGVAASAALAAGVSLVTILQAGDWTRVFMPARHYFSTYITTTDWHQVSVQHAINHFPLEPGCEDYTFLGQAVADFKQGLESILTDSLETSALDTSLEEPDTITSPSVSSGFLHSVSTLSDNSKLQLAPSICTCKLWCEARALLVPVSLATKMSASKLVHYFSSHPAAFGFQASTPADNISLNSANMKADQSLSDFHTSVGATAHATLVTEQLISHLQVALVDTLSSLSEAEGDIIPVSEVCELLLQIHGILDKAVSKQVENSAHILAHLFNSVSRQHYEVWALQLPFLHSLKEVIPPREVCLYGHIN